MPKIFFYIAISMFGLMLPVYAHLDQNSLSIKGSESFTAGENVTITWKMAHAHSNYYHYLYLKNDNQSAWKLIDSVKGQTGLNYSYNWVVPQISSSNVQFRVFLPEFSKNPSERTDNFTIISKTFTVTQPTAVNHDFRPVSSKELSQIQKSGHTLTFDLRGRQLRYRNFIVATNCLVANRKTFIGKMR